MRKNRSRILAVEIRASRLGYAVFELPERLLEFGGSWYDSRHVAKLRISGFLRVFRPSVLVLRGGSRHRSSSWRSLTRNARREAGKLSTSVAQVSEREMRKFFNRQACRNKYDTAALLATWFPEIAWRLPPRRKLYEPEPRAMLYFDSIALATAYLRREIHPG